MEPIKETEMYDWEVKKVQGPNLEEALEKSLDNASKAGWEVFAVLPHVDTVIVVARRAAT